MLTYKITVPDSPHPKLLVKIPDFGHLISLDGTNSFFRLINTKIYIFSILAAGFCPKNLAVARKIMALPESGGLVVHLCETDRNK